MTDLTPLFSQLVESHGAKRAGQKQGHDGQSDAIPVHAVDEFLKEANRIVRPPSPPYSNTTQQYNNVLTNLQNAHITSLLRYLKSIRQSYLSTAPPPPPSRRRLHPQPSPSSSSSSPPTKHLTDHDRDSIDSSTALLLRDLSSSIANLASAETLRRETQASLLRKRFGDHLNNRLWKWAGGSGEGPVPRSGEQEDGEEAERTVKAVRESVLWTLRRGLEGAAEVQRGMVEKRIERAREREKSVLYKNKSVGKGEGNGVPEERNVVATSASATGPVRDVSMGQEDVAAIEAQLSPEQLQLFEQENDSMLKHYEETLSKVQ